jgi:predicted ATPase/DNA-binding SARP family transcriptional activator
MKFEAFLLGGFSVRRNGQDPIQWPRAAPKRLFKMLAVAPSHALPVEQVEAAFWPNDWRDQVRQRLHHVVYLLRSALSGGESAAGHLVEIKDGMVRLVLASAHGESDANGDRATLWIDADHFASSMADALGAQRRAEASDDLPALEQALALYSGPLLPGDSLDEPVHLRREVLQRLHLQGLHAVARRQQSAGNLEAAAQSLRRALAAAATDEDAHRSLMAIHAQRGQLDQVEQQYAACKAVLLRELGVPPSAQTHRAYRAAMLGPQASEAPDAAFAPDASTPPPRLLAPAPLVTLIDRDELQTSTLAMLQSGSSRLVTLVGQGGMGKTQLALSLAHAWSQRLHAETCFVSLAEVDAAGVLDRMRRALHVADSIDTSIEESIVKRLQTMRLLLVMDNCEHVLPTLGLLVRLLAMCPNLVVLATSRRPLNLNAEQVVVVPPLRATEDSAVRLFMERAQAVAPSLKAHAPNATDVLAIVERLEGLPLAIELVAARTHAFSVAELRRQLQAGFGAVAGGGPDRPERHRSLENSLDWSRQLLSVIEQVVLDRATLFAAPFDMEALCAACGDLGAGQTPRDATGVHAPAGPTQITQAVQSLIELGFLRQVFEQGDLETMRLLVPTAARSFMVGQESVDKDPSQAACFVGWYADLALTLDAQLLGANAAKTLARLRIEHDNFFAALAMAKEQSDPTHLIRLVQGLARYWGQSGSWARADAWIHEASERVTHQSADSRATLWTHAAHYWMDCQRYEWAQSTAKQATEAAREAGLLAVQARAANLFCAASYHRGQPHASLDLLKQTLAAAQHAKQDAVAAAVQNNIANCWLAAGDLLRARSAWRACDRLHPAHANQARVPPLFNLAIVAHYRGEHDEAHRLAGQAMDCENSAVPRPARIAFMMVRTSWMWCCRSESALAEQALRRAADAADASNLAVWQRIAMAHAGKVALVRGQSQHAAALLAQGAAQFAGAADPWELLDLRLWLFWAQFSTPSDRDDARETLATLLHQYAPSWLHEHARMLEAAAAWLAHDKHWLPAANAWHEAQRLRKQQGVRRFAIEQAQARRTQALLRQRAPLPQGAAYNDLTLGHSDNDLERVGGQAAMSQALAAVQA